MNLGRIVLSVGEGRLTTKLSRRPVPEPNRPELQCPFLIIPSGRFGEGLAGRLRRVGLLFVVRVRVAAWSVSGF